MLQMPPQAVKFANTIFSLTLISMKDLFVSKGHNSVKYQTWTKSNLDLYLLVKYFVCNFNFVYTSLQRLESRN